MKSPANPSTRPIKTVAVILKIRINRDYRDKTAAHADSSIDIAEGRYSLA